MRSRERGKRQARETYIFIFLVSEIGKKRRDASKISRKRKKDRELN